MPRRVENLDISFMETSDEIISNHFFAFLRLHAMTARRQTQYLIEGLRSKFAHFR